MIYLSPFQYLSSLFLNMLVDVDFTTVWGKLFQSTITRWLKNDCRVVITGFKQLHTMSPAMFPELMVKNVEHSTPSKPFRFLNVSIRLPRNRLFSSEINSSFFHVTSYWTSLMPITIRIALCWTFSKLWISIFKWGDQACMQSSRCGLIYVL